MKMNKQVMAAAGGLLLLLFGGKKKRAASFDEASEPQASRKGGGGSRKKSTSETSAFDAPSSSSSTPVTTTSNTVRPKDPTKTQLIKEYNECVVQLTAENKKLGDLISKINQAYDAVQDTEEEIEQRHDNEDAMIAAREGRGPTVASDLLINTDDLEDDLADQKLFLAKLVKSKKGIEENVFILERRKVGLESLLDLDEGVVSMPSAAPRTAPIATTTAKPGPASKPSVSTPDPMDLVVLESLFKEQDKIFADGQDVRGDIRILKDEINELKHPHLDPGEQLTSEQKAENAADAKVAAKELSKAQSSLNQLGADMADVTKRIKKQQKKLGLPETGKR